MRVIHWLDIEPPGGQFHVARTTLTAALAGAPHRHNFAEVFWVERGPGWHWINSQRRRLEVGDLIFMRPHDRHELGAAAGGKMTITNVAFPIGQFEEIQRRYVRQPGWPWEGGLLPTRLSLSAQQIEPLRQWADGASMLTQTQLDLHWFLLGLLRLATQANQPNDLPDEKLRALPPWLVEAVRRFQNPRQLPGGVAELARLAGKSADHVNRCVARCLGMTAGKLVLHLRMQQAAKLLRLTDRPISQIAAECGMENLSHFYLRFGQHFSCPPHRYRRREQAMVH